MISPIWCSILPYPIFYIQYMFYIPYSQLEVAILAKWCQEMHVNHNNSLYICWGIYCHAGAGPSTLLADSYSLCGLFKCSLLDETQGLWGDPTVGLVASYFFEVSLVTVLEIG